MMKDDKATYYIILLYYILYTGNLALPIYSK